MFESVTRRRALLAVVLTGCSSAALGVDINVNWSAPFSASGQIGGAAVAGNANFGPSFHAFDPRLGTLNSVRTTVSSRSEASIRWNPSLPGGTLLNNQLTFLFRPSIDFGVADVSFVVDAGRTIFCPAGTTDCSRYASGVTLLGIAGGINSVQPFTGTASRDGGSPTLLFRVSNTSAVPLTGTWATEGTARITQTYTARSRQEYIRDAVQGSGSDFQRAFNGVDEVIALREHDAATSSGNLALRDAEYFLRGYSGGRGIISTVLDVSSFAAAYNDFANRTGPVGASGYNAIKYIRNYLGQNISGPDNLPASPPGGIAANYAGWRAGINGVNLDQATGLAVATPRAALPGQPQIPDVRIPFFDGEVDTFFLAPGDGPVRLDPQMRNSVAYGFLGNLASSLMIITPFDGEVSVIFGDHSVNLRWQQLLSFTDFVTGGVDGFLITGFPSFTPDSPALLVDIGFTSTAPVLVTAIAFDGMAAPVPEPATYAMLLLGVAMLHARGRVQIWNRMRQARTARTRSSVRRE